MKKMVWLLMMMLIWVENNMLKIKRMQRDKLMRRLSQDLDSIYAPNIRFKEDDLDEVVKDMDNEQNNFEDLQQLLDTLNTTNNNSLTKSQQDQKTLEQKRFEQKFLDRNSNIKSSLKSQIQKNKDIKAIKQQDKADINQQDNSFDKQPQQKKQFKKEVDDIQKPMQPIINIEPKNIKENQQTISNQNQQETKKENTEQKYKEKGQKEIRTKKVFIPDAAKSYFQDTKITRRISDYSRQVLKDRNDNTPRGILRRLQQVEQGSSYSEKPQFAQSVVAPSLTPTDSTVNEQEINNLWRSFRADTYEGVIYKGNEIPQTRIGSQVFETTIPEKEVKIDNRLDIQPDKAELIQQAAEQLTKVANPLKREQYDHDVRDDRFTDIQPDFKQIDSGRLFRALANDLDQIQ